MTLFALRPVVLEDGTAITGIVCGGGRLPVSKLDRLIERRRAARQALDAAREAHVEAQREWCAVKAEIDAFLRGLKGVEAE